MSEFGHLYANVQYGCEVNYCNLKACIFGTDIVKNRMNLFLQKWTDL